MAKKKAESSQPVIVCRSKNQGCWHAGVFYEPGTLLPEMPLRCLNVHLGGGNVEMVEVDTETIEAVEPAPDVDDTIAIINQVIEDDHRATL